jgi:hypothetical protein
VNLVENNVKFPLKPMSRVLGGRVDAMHQHAALNRVDMSGVVIQIHGLNR